MASEYKQEFLESAQAEISALAAEGTWIEDLRTNATTRIVPNQWVFRIKRSPDGEVDSPVMQTVWFFTAPVTLVGRYWVGSMSVGLDSSRLVHFTFGFPPVHAA
jgi:hypothetical protein